MSSILDVVIGLSFIYIILSLISATLTEFISQFWGLRANNLRQAIRTILNDVRDGELVAQFYNHPLISSLRRERGGESSSSNPSYIPSHAFTLALLDILVNDDSDIYRPIRDLNAIKTSLTSNRYLVNNKALRRQLEIIVDLSETVSDTFLIMETWFNDTMNRASGWYKRRIREITLLAAIIVVVGINADSIMLYNRLSTDPTARGAIIAAAQGFLSNPENNPSNNNGNITVEPETTPEPNGSDAGTTEGTAGSEDGSIDIAATRAEIERLQSLINDEFQIVGWSEDPTDMRSLPTTPAGWAMKIVGLALTVLAVSMGAPFWYDTLSKLVNLSASGKKESTDSSSSTLPTERLETTTTNNTDS